MDYKFLAFAMITMFFLAGCSIVPSPIQAEQEYINAQEAFDKNNYDQAITHFQNVTALKPNDHMAYSMIAVCYFEKKEHLNAIKWQKKSVSIRPDEASEHGLLAIYYMQAGDYENSAKVNQQAIKLNPDYKDAYFNLGVCQYKLKDYKQAAVNFEKALSLDPKDADTHKNLNKTYEKLGVAKKIEIPQKPQSYSKRNLQHDSKLLASYLQKSIWTDTVRVYSFINGQVMRIRFQRNYDKFYDCYYSYNEDSGVLKYRSVQPMTFSKGEITRTFAGFDNSQYRRIIWKEVPQKVNRWSREGGSLLPPKEGATYEKSNLPRLEKDSSFDNLDYNNRALRESIDAAKSKE